MQNICPMNSVCNLKSLIFHPVYQYRPFSSQVSHMVCLLRYVNGDSFKVLFQFAWNDKRKAQNRDDDRLSPDFGVGKLIAQPGRSW
jgi:hypothetical protein